MTRTGSGTYQVDGDPVWFPSITFSVDGRRWAVTPVHIYGDYVVCSSKTGGEPALYQAFRRAEPATGSAAWRFAGETTNDPRTLIRYRSRVKTLPAWPGARLSALLDAVTRPGTGQPAG